MTMFDVVIGVTAMLVALTTLGVTSMLTDRRQEAIDADRLAEEKPQVDHSNIGSQDSADAAMPDSTASEVTVLDDDAKTPSRRPRVVATVKGPLFPRRGAEKNARIVGQLVHAAEAKAKTVAVGEPSPYGPIHSSSPLAALEREELARNVARVREQITRLSGEPRVMMKRQRLREVQIDLGEYNHSKDDQFTKGL